jgi:hypothetical protein
MTEQELLDLEALASQATAGPWKMCHSISGGEVWTRDTQVGDFINKKNGAADAIFIAAAREAVPALIAEVRRLKAIDIDEYRNAIEFAYWDYLTRKAGDGPYKHRPQSDRDAYHQVCRNLLRDINAGNKHEEVG